MGLLVSLAEWHVGTGWGGLIGSTFRDYPLCIHFFLGCLLTSVSYNKFNSYSAGLVLFVKYRFPTVAHVLWSGVVFLESTSQRA